MSFTGKATYSAGPDLPEIAEDISDIVGIVSPYETPLLDALGDPARSARSTVHEWLEDSLLPNQDAIDHQALADDGSVTSIDVAHADRFRVGDQVQAAGSREVMFVTGVSGSTLGLVRGYGGTPQASVADGDTLHILGNAALEGDDAPTARFTTRSRKSNVTQIFTATVEVSGSELAARQAAVADELAYQKQERARELLRDLENTVLNGVSRAADDDPQGSSTIRRTMRGIVPSLATHRTDAGTADLTEPMLNAALRDIWQSASTRIDTLVVGGLQKRRINGFVTASRGYSASTERFKDLVGVYESDFGVCRVVLCRWAPADMVLMLDSSRIDVMPLTGRSFHYKPLARTGDRESGQVLGEYTLEICNENAHGLIALT